MKRCYSAFVTPLVLLILFISFNTASAQQSGTVVHFASDSTVFFNQMEKFMKSARDEDGKVFIEEFEIYWYGGRFDEEQRQEVYNICNLMLQKRKRAFPDFRDYIYSILGFLDSKTQRPQNFYVWNKTLQQILESGGRKEFNEYLSFSRTLFEENVITKTRANSWKADNDNYIFEFDSLPKITFESVNLKCFARNDSAVIYNTSGSYYPTKYTWYGDKGKIDWQRAGFKPDRVYATFNQYQLDTRKTEFVIDSATFTNVNYFGDKKLKGKVIEKVLALSENRAVTYPIFESYNNKMGIRNVESEVDYDGGFTMSGERFIGQGAGDKASRLIFYRNGQPFFVVTSDKFLIQVDKITSDDAEVKIYLEEDSIYHPGVIFKFFREERKISLIKDRSRAKSLSAFYNTFHKIDMQFEVLEWNQNENEIVFTNLQGSTKREALFESANFFSRRRYDKLQGMASVNPLVQIRALTIKMDTTELTLKDLARFMKIPSNQVELLLMDLRAKGMIDYSYEDKIFKVKERLFNYVYARTGKRDYDIIQFYSNVKTGENARLNLNNLDMKIDGIDHIFLSDSQQVVIFPDNGEITLKKNRDFLFAGVVKAGRLDFFGKEFSFEYDNFKINLTNVDSLRMKAELPDVDEYGRKKLTPVKSVIEGINGELLIDNPDNKSARHSLPKYPIFNSMEDSYVYYNKKEVLDGVYKKNEVYFHLKPFTIDSLDNFSNAGLKFEGDFESNGIFPQFSETLSLQPDYSLGFTREAPPEGYPVYSGKGQFYNSINLSNNGLRGDGKVEYITSTTLSDDMIFYPDSMVTIADSYEIEPVETGVQFPPVSGGGVKVSWIPESDVMYTDKRDSSLAFYDGKSYLHGRTILRPTGLSGKGVFEFERAELESNLIDFKFSEFDSDTADFRLKDLELAGELSFTTENVNAHIDFDKRVGQFKSNGGGSFIKFPANEYMSYMEEFNWYMDTEDIEMTAGDQEQDVAVTDSADVKLEGAEFISTNIEQDSLNFFSTKARYDLRKKVIYANGVQYVNTADARIIPDSGALVIRKKAVMDPLTNAGIIANTTTKYHNIYNATAYIFGKKSYSAKGTIDYTDENGNKQSIYLEEIKVDTTIQTVGRGVIGGTDNFTLSPAFDYQGRVLLKASSQFLTFDGATRISHECQTLDRHWMKFKTEVDPKAIYIPIGDEVKNMAGSILLSSVMLGADSSGVYSAFLSEQSNNSDVKLLPANGFLYYDKPSKEYRISNKDKILEQSFSGNYLSLNTNSCKIYGEGIVDVGAELGQVSLNSAGSIIHTLKDDEVIFDLLAILEFHMEDNALKEIAKILNANIALDPVKVDRKNYEKALQEILGKENADKLISDLSLYGSFKKFPDELNKSMVFSELKFKYNRETNTYDSFGTIGIGNILKEQVNKYVPGKVQITKRRSGDKIDIYLEAGSGKWFYFSYTRGIMYTVSSSETYNNIIKEVKPDKAKLPAKRNQTPYKFIITTNRKKDDFLKRFELN